ncbi:LacI family DNA-binding transcriptional regulator [Mucilaginibacter terrae]|uniref:LacI family transcriptional regulator n=1 Tax=Mucilaginibacter terrae TaxID=1955052 RepID=A0ABU3GN15_9SPHI|nr:LacI family DNA-binding transcriptional regulator [Mucilaginibacter terrae]MDT3401174.1 LacI family transcriptional regulator [Mucilaginibacter terrae]
MKKKLSIKDIAEQLHVSKTTISWVLNGKADQYAISKALQRKILKHIEKVGYKPNRMAQGLRTGKSKTIGILIEDISDAFFSTLARRFEEILGKKGYRIVYGSTENNTEITKELIQVFRNHQVDGFIIVPAPGIESTVKELVDEKTPVVFIDRPLSDYDGSCVLVDNFRGTAKAIQHLIDNGYQHIAMVTLSSDQAQMRERERGYQITASEAGMDINVLKIKYHEPKDKAVIQLKNFLNKHKETDALFFATNYLAEIGLETILDLKKNIPDQIGIVVFDDANLFRFFKPSITAIAQPIQSICEQAVQLLFEQLESTSEVSPRIVQLPTSLTIRDSSANRLSKAKIPK